MRRTYTKGERIRLEAGFSVNGEAADPSTITLRIRKASGTYSYSGDDIEQEIDETASPSGPIAGSYQREVTLDVSGEWFYRWEGTGLVETAEEKRLFVRPSRF